MVKAAHTLYREIHEQGEVIERALVRESGPAAALADAVRQQGVALAMIVARGSSDHAAVYGKYLLESFAALPVALAAPSLYTLYGHPPRLSDALVVAISQSGQSPDLVAVLEEAGRQGALTAAIVNVRQSPLAAVARQVLWCGAGPELAVAATKSYSAELILLAMLASSLAGDPGLTRAMALVPAAVRSALSLDRQVAELAGSLAGIDRCAVLARGYAYATALETALKIKETCYVGADAYSAADFLHGPIAVVEPGFPVILFGAAGPAAPGLYELARTLSARGARTIAVTDDPALAALVEHPLRLEPGLPEWLAPIAQVVVGQLLAYHLCVAKGYDPDRPRGLQKVTSTR